LILLRRRNDGEQQERYRDPQLHVVSNHVIVGVAARRSV